MLVATLASPPQTHPTFAGRWTFDAPPPVDAARVLVVEQPVIRTNVRGEPMPPTYLHLSVRREGPSGTTTDKYIIGTSGGTVGGFIDSNGKAIATPSSYIECLWRGDTLTFLNRRDGLDGPHTGDWSERSESWSLEADGRLRVEITTEAHDRARQTTVLHYHRE